jgi:glycine dehydrogenase subunit 1
VVPDAFFNEFAVRLPRPAAEVVTALAGQRILAGVPASRLFGSGVGVDDILLVAASELTTDADMDALCAGLAEVLA